MMMKMNFMELINSKCGIRDPSLQNGRILIEVFLLEVHSLLPFS